MRQSRKIIKLINYIIQKKKYNTCLFKKTNDIQLDLLNFLWKNKFIYGYKFLDRKIYMIFMKTKMINNRNSYKLYKQNLNSKDITNKKVWDKNSFYIINKNRKFYTLKDLYVLKIGGFLTYKIT